MTSDPFSAAQSSSATGSCLLSCQTVCQTDDSHCLDVGSHNDSNSLLCFKKSESERLFTRQNMH